MDYLLQVAKDAKQPIDDTEVEKVTVAHFESGYTLDGLPILPPLMTDEKRMEMRILRLEAALKKSQMPDLKAVQCPTVEAATETLPPDPKPCSENKETNTDSGVEPLIVMGRFRQKLTQSETVIYDHTRNLVIQIGPPDNTPVTVVSQMVMEDVPASPTQRAVTKITPLTMATQKSSWVSRLDPPKPDKSDRLDSGTEKPTILRRSNTCVDSTKLHHQLWRRNRLEVNGQRLLEVLKSPIKTAENSDGGTRPIKEESKVKPRSKIPLIQKKVKIIEAQPVISPGHEACHEPSAPVPVKCQSAAERRKNYDQKVAINRNNMAKKREESMARQKVVPKPNLPKSIRTPVSAHARLGLVDADFQVQRIRFQSMVSRQADEQQRLQAEFEKQQQELMDKMLGDLSHVTSEASADNPPEIEIALSSCSAVTTGSCSSTNSLSISPS
ncbi:hypothetical protein KR067_000764 [Drosophila pandora]|nr:hypothetical protein KR067_000764 [Drosophila pandora]